MASRLASGAAVDRYESDRKRHTAVISFVDTTKDRRAEEEGRGATTVEYGQEGEDEVYKDEYYYEDEYEDGLSGDYEMELPRGKALASSILPFLKFLSTAAIPFYVLLCERQ